MLENLISRNFLKEKFREFDFPKTFLDFSLDICLILDDDFSRFIIFLNQIFSITDFFSFLFKGVDEAREFDQLPPEESRARLGKIVDRIDSNEDGYEKFCKNLLEIYVKINLTTFLFFRFVTLDEMRDWIRFTQQRYITEDVDRQWTQHNVEQKEAFTWAEYR